MRRNRNKKIKYVIISSMALVVFTVTVAYASLSSQLIVSGNVGKKGGTWNIYLDSPLVYDTTGSAKSEKVELLNDNKTLNIYASLTQPGDSITYSFKVMNGGTIDAQFIKWGFVNASQVNALTNNKISTTLTYENGSPVTPGDILLAKGGSNTFKLTFKYNGAEAITSDDIFLSIQIEFLYGQLTAATS